MNCRETFGVEISDGDSVTGSAVDSVAKSVKNTLRGICDSFRRLIRNAAFITQVSVSALGVVGCDTSLATEEPDYPAQCASKIFPSEPDNTPQCDNAMSDSPVVKNVAVCFMRWSDAVDLTDEVRAELNAEFDLATRFFDEVTFGRDHYEFKLVDPGVVWAGPRPKGHDDEVKFAIEACAPQIDFDEVDTFVVFPVTGTDYGERKTVNTPQGSREIGVVRLSSYAKNYNVPDTFTPNLYNLRHELGHASKRWNHATEYVCEDKSTKQKLSYSPNPEDCQVVAYDNPFDLMGGGITISKPDSQRIFGHPGGFEKSLDGLVTVTTIETSGTYPLAAVEVPCSNLPQLLKVPYDGNPNLPLCLEYRQPIGFDAPFSEKNVGEIFGFESGLPSGGCLSVQICSNDQTTLGYGSFDYSGKGFSSMLIQSSNGEGAHQHQRDQLGVCIPPEGFCDSNLGINVNWHRSKTNPNAVIVDVSGVDEARIARSPNLTISKIKPNFSPILSEYVHIQNVSETGESVGTFDIQISGKRISDGQFELIETRTVDGLPLFGKVSINFPPDLVKLLRLIYFEVRVIADSGNVIEETNEADNEETFGIAK